MLAFVPSGDEELAAETVTELLNAFNGFQLASGTALGHAEPEFGTPAAGDRKLSSLGLTVQRALAESEEISGVNAISLTPQRLVIGVAVSRRVVAARVPVVILVVLAAAALAIGYRWYLGFQDRGRALEAAAFSLHGKTFRGRERGRNGEKRTAIDQVNGRS